MEAGTQAKPGQVQWNIDPNHTSIHISVRHLGIFTVRGSLQKITGTVETTDGKLARVQAEIDAASINTGNTDRDNHLRSADFLDTDKFPVNRFSSTQIQSAGAGQYEVTGNLEIHGQSHPVTIQVETAAPIKDPFGLVRAGATATGEISRKQWGLVWNQVMETGSVMIGDEIKFTIDVQAVVGS